MSQKFKKYNQKGFSFLELILAIFIVSVPLLVFVETIVKSVEHSTESRDVIIASNLAQEGVELIKNVRDNNWAQKKGVFNNLGATSNCAISYDYDINNPCTNANMKLYLKNGFYKHDSSGNPTKFSRKISIAEDGSGEARIVTSYVTWENGDWNSCLTSNKCVYAIITLTKWGGE